MPLKILADRYIPGVVQAFAGLAEVRLCEPADIASDQLQDCDALLVRTVTRVDAGLLEDTPVRFVGTATSGTDHIDHAYLQQQGIGFADAAGSNARPVAEYVLSALAVMCERRDCAFSDLSVGIVGCGHVGSLLAEMLTALGTRVLLNDPPLVAAGDTRTFTDLETVLAADVVSLHVPLTTVGEYPTHQLLGAERLACLRPGALLINTARGGVVDEAALERAIRDNDLQAVVDVWQDEPMIDAALAARVFLATPHIAGYSLEAKWRATQSMRTAVLEYFELDGGPQNTDVCSAMPARLSLPAADLSEQVSLAILASYDVRTDAAPLQRLPQVPVAERANWFIHLRQDYGLRREFSAVALALPAASQAADCLRQLGFRVAE